MTNDRDRYVFVDRARCPKCGAWGHDLKTNRSIHADAEGDGLQWKTCLACGHSFVVVIVLPEFGRTVDVPPYNRPEEGKPCP